MWGGGYVKFPPNRRSLGKAELALSGLHCLVIRRKVCPLYKTFLSWCPTQSCDNGQGRHHHKDIKDLKSSSKNEAQTLQLPYQGSLLEIRIPGCISGVSEKGFIKNKTQNLHVYDFMKFYHKVLGFQFLFMVGHLLNLFYFTFYFQDFRKCCILASLVHTCPEVPTHAAI